MHSERSLNSAQILGFAKADVSRKVPLEEVVVEAYVSLRPALLGYLHHIVGSTGEAEDLVQVTFLKLFDQLQKNAEIRELRGWLYKVAHNLAMDSLRTRGREEPASDEWLHEQSATGDSVETDMIRKQQVRNILGVLNVREIRAKSVVVYLGRGLKKIEGPRV